MLFKDRSHSPGVKEQQALKEIRDVLEHTQFADEISKALTKLSFEIRTEIRFIPNDNPLTSENTSKSKSNLQPAHLKPEVSVNVTMKDASRKQGGSA